MKKIVVSTLVLSLIIFSFAALTVGAHGGRPGSSNVDQRPAYQQSNINNLEEEQLEEIADFQEEYFDQRQELTERLRDKRVELRAEILKDETTERLNSLEEEVANIQDQINEAQTEYLKNMGEVLNEDQVNMILEEGNRIGLGKRSFGPGTHSFSFNRRSSQGNRPGQKQSKQNFNSSRAKNSPAGRGLCF
ncbi:MAG: hypothetical protein R6V14_05330 [Halanaerobiales bacterium]